MEGGESRGVCASVLGAERGGHIAITASTSHFTTDELYHSCQTCQRLLFGGLNFKVEDFIILMKIYAIFIYWSTINDNCGTITHYTVMILYNRAIAHAVNIVPTLL